jgi:hypothetical protein
MSWPILTAGALGLLAAAIHGGVGEWLLLRKIPRDTLPATLSGSPATSWLMVWVSWHIVTATFALTGLALVYVGTHAGTAMAPGVAMLAGVLYACFAAFVVASAASSGEPLALIRHPAPIGLSAIAVLTLWGAQGL